MALTNDMIIWIVITFLVYGIFLCYRAFGREEPLENLAYIAALVPGNFLWYVFTTPENIAEYGSFGALGAAIVIIGLWLVAVVRDLIFKDRDDWDDMVLFLVVGVLIQCILYAVLPSDVVLPGLQGDGATYILTRPYWRYFHMPNLEWMGYSRGLVYGFKGLATALVVVVTVPLVMDLKGTKVPAWGILVFLGLFAIPLAFVSWLWLPDSTGAWIAMFALELVILGIVFLKITTSTKDAGN